MSLKVHVVATVIALPVFAVVVALPVYLAHVANLKGTWWERLIVIVILILAYRAVLPRVFFFVGQRLRSRGRT